MSTEDCGPAFPVTSEQWNTGLSGMSLRDYFAGQALALGGEFFHSIDDQSDPPNDAEHCARVAYAIADAMLIARKL